MRSGYVVVVVASLFAVVSAAAQSAEPPKPTGLAKAAADAEQQRKDRTKAAKAFTNADLRSDDQVAPTSTTTAAAPAAPDVKLDGTQIEKLNSNGRGESYWKDRMRGLTERLQTAQDAEAAVAIQLDELVADYRASTQSLRRVVIDREIIRTRGDLLKKHAAVLSCERAVANLEEEARRAGVPPGWLRF